jgi:glutamate:GABA antiporter
VQRQSKRVLSVFSLVMINVIAVDSLRTLPITAKLGLALISYYALAAFVFFIPVALVAAELATAYPETGGIYVWVREAFGKQVGLLTIWFQWIYNIVWYPTIMAFIASTLAILISPELATNKFYILAVSLILFWLFTALNCFGMKISGIVSTVGALIGTLIPMVGIIALGAMWLFDGRTTEISMPASWIPDLTSVGNLSIFSAVLFGLLGMEMSAVHAEEVKNPQKDYPRSLIYSTIIIFSSLVLGSMAIVLVVPVQKVNIVSGLIDAYKVFFDTYNLPWMTEVIAALIILGGLSCVSAWIIGPTKGLLVAARDGSIPHKFAMVNKYGAPVRLLIVQGLIFSLLSSLFVFVDSISTAYIMLSALCAQLALFVYVFMFAAAIKLRYTKPHLKRAYKIPGGNVVMWMIAVIGALSCLLTIGVSFVPPTQIPVKNLMLFEGFLATGWVFFVIFPWFVVKKLK